MVNKIHFILVAFFLLIFLAMPQCFAGEQNLRSLDFDVTAKDNGDVTIVETWDIKVYDTNTLYKTFARDGDYDFKDISVVDFTDGTNKQYTDVGRWMYHVTPGGFYGAENDEGDFEIGWSANSENKTSNKKYKITYTVTNLIDVYNDCAALYWKLVGYGASIIPADKVTGTIHLPHTVSNLEDLRVWAHGPLSGEIHKVDGNTVSLSVNDLYANDYLEIRIVTPPGIYETSTNVFKSNMLQSIIAEETEWADEANAARERAQQINKMVNGGVIIVAVVVVLICLKDISKVKSELLDTPDQKVQKLDYFRDFPDETATPGEAEFMRTTVGFNTQNVLSAIFMDLAYKKVIDVEPIDGDKKNAKIIVKPIPSDVQLKQDESAVYNFIVSAVGGVGSITMKDFRRYCDKRQTTTYNLWTGLKEKALNQCRVRGSFDMAMQTKGVKYAAKGSGAYVLGVFAIIGMFMLWASSTVSSYITIGCAAVGILAMFIAGFYNMKITKSYCGYSIQGWEENQKWCGLKKYMEDFSLLNEKDIPDLALWERFLVYATAFGISEKVIKQLKVAYPQLQDDAYMMNHYRTMYYMHHMDLGRSFGSNMQHGYQSYVSSQMSSGSGGGGGFSGGGGGGHGGGGSGGR